METWPLNYEYIIEVGICLLRICTVFVDPGFRCVRFITRYFIGVNSTLIKKKKKKGTDEISIYVYIFFSLNYTRIATSLRMLSKL